MTTPLLNTRVLRPLAAAALLALTTGCATGEKSSPGLTPKPGGDDFVIDLNHPGPHQDPSILVTTTADNLSPQSRLAHPKRQVRVRIRIKPDPLDPRNVIVTHAIENAD